MPSSKLSDRQKRFCLFYVQDFNARAAALKAGYCPDYVYELMNKSAVRNYIKKLKRKMTEELICEGIDILKMYESIAFSDITGYIEFGSKKTKKGTKGSENFIRLKNSAKVDGRIISEISINSRGVPSIKLCDKYKALEKLEKLFDLLPDTWKRKLEEEKLQLKSGDGEAVINIISDVPEP
ncbi:MAG: terminase small subunit [Bacillota bacterium]|nr:terminase small subunit [Bacillota bacterium]